MRETKECLVKFEGKQASSSVERLHSWFHFFERMDLPDKSRAARRGNCPQK